MVNKNIDEIHINHQIVCISFIRKKSVWIIPLMMNEGHLPLFAHG